jgi:hypothetical protein
VALSKAKLESDKRHQAKLDLLKIQPYKEEGQRIRQAAADVLKQVVNAIPDGVDKGFVGVTVDAGDNLLGLVENNGDQANFNPALAAFPAQTVDGVPSNVVTLAYADAQGKSVVENYAFSTADATLVKLY